MRYRDPETIIRSRYAALTRPQAARRGRFSPNVGRTERIASVLAGIGLTTLAFRQRGEKSDTKYAAAGLGLLARGISGYCPVSAAIGRNTASASSDTRQALAGPRGTRVEASVTINRPIEEVYAFWRRLENLPRFMSHLQSVREFDNRRSHWVAKAPLGATVEWDAVIINEIPNELIGWRSLDNSDVISAGSVRFQEAADGRGVEVKVTLQYDPPGGRVGASLAWLLGEDPSRQIPDDLDRFKEMLESQMPTPEARPKALRPDAGLFMQ